MLCGAFTGKTDIVALQVISCCVLPSSSSSPGQEGSSMARDESTPQADSRSSVTTVRWRILWGRPQAFSRTPRACQLDLRDRAATSSAGGCPSPPPSPRCRREREKGLAVDDEGAGRVELHGGAVERVEQRV